MIWENRQFWPMLEITWKLKFSIEISYFLLGAMSATRFDDPMYKELEFLLEIVRMKEKMFGNAE